MMVISANTKISALIRANPAVIGVIAGINPHFRKLQNPFLRKFLAPRVTISEAAKIGRCDLETFFERLEPLGFTIDHSEWKIREHDLSEREVSGFTIDHTERANTGGAEEETPAELQHFDIKLDVRADIENNNDPFRKIMAAVSGLSTGEVLLLVNSFEPVPLIRILEEKGYGITVQHHCIDEVHTYIEHTPETRSVPVSKAGAADPRAEADHQTEKEFEEKKKQFEGRMVTIDVRSLPMPQPMMRILEALQELGEDKALFVYHKKVPMFLLPELKTQHFGHVLRQSPDGVHMIIYREEEKHETG